MRAKRLSGSIIAQMPTVFNSFYEIQRVEIVVKPFSKKADAVNQESPECTDFASNTIDLSCQQSRRIRM